MKKVRLLLLIPLFLLIGWVKCIVNAASCNYEPIGKAEIFYVAGSLVPPLGGVVGWFNIEDK